MKGANAAVLTFLLLAIGFVGCEPMVLHEGDAAADSNVSGTWSYVDTSGARSTWILTQDDDASIEGTGTASETIAGFISGDSVAMTVTYSTNLTTSVDGTVSDGTMAGTFTNSVSERGAWTAYRIQ